MNIGFMQGRMSPTVNGRIQAFPWEHWETEFQLAHQNGFTLMEWILGQERLYENPLMTKPGREKIRTLSKKHGVLIESLTGDCFMQSPFYKMSEPEYSQGLRDAENIIVACGDLEIQYIIIPLVDAGRLEDHHQENLLLTGMERLLPILKQTGCKLAFEIDYTPKKVATFIHQLDSSYFGINYDYFIHCNNFNDPIGTSVGVATLSLSLQSQSLAGCRGGYYGGRYLSELLFSRGE